MMHLSLSLSLSLSSQRLVYSLPDQSLPDIFTAIVQSSFEEKLKILDAVDLPERFDAALALIQRQITVTMEIMNFRLTHCLALVSLDRLHVHVLLK